MKTLMQHRDGPRTPELRIRAAAGDGLKGRIHEAVAWRAFELYEARGGKPGHDAEDWKQAEREVVRPLPCGTVEQDHRICLTADTSCFERGPIELWLEPRRLTLAGPVKPGKAFPEREGPFAQSRDRVFFVHDFPVDVDPAVVTARFNGPALDIYVAKAGARMARMAALAA